MSVSFGAGIATGVLVGTLIAMTSVGFIVGVFVGGAAAVGVGYGVKEIVGWIYD